MKNLLRSTMMIALILLLGISMLNAQTILCVDRDFGDTTSGSYTDTWPAISRALDAAGYTYDYWEVLNSEDNGPDLTEMGNYDVVIWFTGETWVAPDPMTPIDESNILLYVALGGKLFLNAQDYLYAIYPDAGTFDPGTFPYEVLGLVEVVQDVYQIEPGDPGSIGDSATFYGSPGSLAEGLLIPTHDIFTTDDGLYGDSLAQHLGQDLMGIVQPYNSTGPAAIQYESSYHRSVFSTIDIAAITDTVVRDVLMHRIVDWLMYGPTGVNELKASDMKLVMKPNPVSQYVEMGMMNPMDEVEIFNNQGQVVRHVDVNKASVRMDLGDLPSGMYIVKVKTAEGIVTDKLIKQ
ncbi:MAG TPA: T9SS type A sorting domain-containing protein [Bacteroidales bacterium]|nr:T9SS type A sorting domain-containing protein [Bacteroidales bacterium]